MGKKAKSLRIKKHVKAEAQKHVKNKV